MATRLTKRFYQRPTEKVAAALLGKVLVHHGLRARITECEAYLGAEDLASHARFGRTGRSQAMFRAGGHTYVYLCYGIHHMFNVVTDLEDRPGAVLIRAVTLLNAPDATRSDGPGKLTRALGLNMAHNGLDLTGTDALYLSRGRGSLRVSAEDIEIGPRVEIDYAGEWAAAPLRFQLRSRSENS